MSADFLLELLSEEIPARMQSRARNDLARLFAEGLEAAGLRTDGITTYSTPRRLALIAKALPLSTQAVSEDIKGPRTSAPAQAIEGFLRKTGLTRDQLEDRDGTWFAVIDKPGQPTADVLSHLIPQIVRDFPWPKSMRWGDASGSSASLRWVRPLHSIVAILGEDVVDVAIDGVSSSAATLGHRFHHPGPITIGGASDYVEKLHACHVLVDQEEREFIVQGRARELADEAGYQLIEDEGLVIENAGLTEFPVPLLGSFDPDYLDVPEEVIQLTARLNQKYFVLRDPMSGKLAPHFVCTANIDPNDGGEAIIAGNERVLAARLSDARFFWEQDLKIPLAELTPKLGEIVFHERLGSLGDKVERVAALARWLAETGVVRGVSGDDAARAARLAKADLVTGMVGEFPELQGVIGGYLARAQGEGEAIADAVRDHYKPVGQGDEVPTAPLTVAVGLADKLDTLATFFVADLLPTGSKDPFALRRAAIGAAALILENDLRFELSTALVQSMARVLGKSIGEVERASFDEAMKAMADAGFALHPFLREGLKGAAQEQTVARGLTVLTDVIEPAFGKLLEFFADRLKVQQREAGVRHDLIDAVFALGGEDDLVRLLARVRALQAFVETQEGTNLLAGYKRAGNILKKEQWDASLSSGSSIDAAEQALMNALDEAEPQAHRSVAEENFTSAMAALASLRAPIDEFFDAVTVNADDPGIRSRRLALLARFRTAVHTVADFSRIEG